MTFIGKTSQPLLYVIDYTVETFQEGHWFDMRQPHWEYPFLALECIYFSGSENDLEASLKTGRPGNNSVEYSVTVGQFPNIF